MSLPAERRSKQRYEIRLPAELVLPDGRVSDCLVLDYCSGGMLIKRSGAETEAVDGGWRSGQPLHLKTTLQTGKGMQAIAVGGSVAWARGEHFGLAFDEPSDDVVQALQRHDRLARGDVSDSRSSGPVSETRGLARLRQYAQGALPALLRDLLVKAGEDLLEAADVVTSDSERQQLYGDTNAIDNVREGDSLTRAVLSAAFDGRLPRRRKRSRPKAN